MSDPTADVHAAASVTIAVLAGGASTRMGRPKAHLRVRGQPILDYLLDRWGWPGPTMLVTAPGREHPPDWERFTLEAADPIADAGPLRGVLTALEAVQTELLIVTTCDMPGASAEQFRWLIDQLRGQKDRLGAMSRRGDVVEPFPLVLRALSRDVVAARYASGQRSTYRLAEMSQFPAIPAPPQWPDATWMNLNAPDDLKRFEASL